MNPELASEKSSGNFFWPCVFFICLGSILLNLNGLRVDHVEGDEVIFTFLAEKIIAQPFSYNLQGELSGDSAKRFIKQSWEPQWDPSKIKFAHLQSAAVLLSPPDPNGRQYYKYDPKRYGKKLFFHPPLYPFALSFFRRIFSFEYGVLLSLLFHLGSILLTILIGRELCSEKVGLCSGFLLSLESISILGATRLWIDGMLQFMACLTIYTALVAHRTQKTQSFIVAGITLGLAGLTKSPAGLLFIPGVYILIFHGDSSKKKNILLYALIALGLVLPWLILTKYCNGEFLTSSTITEELKQNYPFLKRISERPFYYYILALLAASPFTLFSFSSLFFLRKHKWLLTPLIWAFTFLLSYTLLGYLGTGYQLRYLMPAMPAFCLLASYFSIHKNGLFLIPLAFLGLLSAFTGTESALMRGYAEPIPHALGRYLLEVFQINLPQIFPKIW